MVTILGGRPGSRDRFVMSSARHHTRDGAVLMKGKSSVKRMVMFKQNEMTYLELHERFIRACEARNLSEYRLSSIT